MTLPPSTPSAMDTSAADRAGPPQLSIGSQSPETSSHSGAPTPSHDSSEDEQASNGGRTIDHGAAPQFLSPGAIELQEIRRSLEYAGPPDAGESDIESLLAHDRHVESASLAGGARAEEEKGGDYTIAEERAVLAKLDRRLVLFLALLYMLSFLDRSNIGNAAIAGLNADLGLTSNKYEWLLSGFYITYILFEWMTLLYKVLPPHIYIALCVAGWGLVASLQSIANSFGFLLVLRLLLGITEAAFGPGVPFYLSFFFKRDELALRTGLFISAAPLATSFASSLAWVILRLGENGQIAGWRLLFLVEGFPSMIVAVFAWYIIPDSPATARFLTVREKKVAQRRLHSERERSSAHSSGLKWAEVLEAVLDPKCYLTAFMFFSGNVAFSSLPPFLPKIINDMDYSPLTSQILSAPPYLVSFVLVLVTAWLSDRFRSRSAFIIACSALATTGYGMIAIAGYVRASAHWRYAGVYLAAAGFFSAITLIITWTVNNQSSDSKRGAGVVILNVVGQLGPLLGTRLYPESDAPFYVRGMSICAGFMALVGVLALALRLVLVRENKKRKQVVEYQPVGGGLGAEGGNSAPDESVEDRPWLQQRHGQYGPQRQPTSFIYML